MTTATTPIFWIDNQGGRPNGWVGGWEWFTGWEDVARLSLPFPCTLILPLQDWDNWRRKSIDDWLHSQRSHWPSCNRRDNTATWGEAEGACLEEGGRLFVAATLSRTFYTEAHPMWRIGLNLPVELHVLNLEFITEAKWWWGNWRIRELKDEGLCIWPYMYFVWALCVFISFSVRLNYLHNFFLNLLSVSLLLMDIFSNPSSDIKGTEPNIIMT